MEETYNEHCSEHCLVKDQVERLFHEMYGNGSSTSSLTSRMTSVENKVSLNNKFTYAIFLTLVMQVIAEFVR